MRVGLKPTAHVHPEEIGGPGSSADRVSETIIISVSFGLLLVAMRCKSK